MNTTDYFTNINAMFLFCIFTCGLLVWAVIRGYILNGKMTKEQDSHLKATLINTKLNKALEDEKKVSENMEKLLRQVETEIRELQDKLDHAEADRIELRAERATLENKLTYALAKVRKRDKDGKFLPSGNGRVRTPKKLKLVTDLGENEVIRCSTFKQAEKLHSLDDRILIQHWKVYKKNTAFRPKCRQYSSVQFYEDNGYTIHPASDFIARPKRVKKVSLKVSTDITAVEDAVDSVYNVLTKIKAVSDTERAFDGMMGNPIEQLDGLTVKPKLIHGLTVKNPTEDERED